MNPYALLALAIVCEVVATTALRLSDGFSRPLPTVAVAVGYGAAFYLMSLALKSLPLGFVYAVWAGAGTALVAVLSVVVFRDQMNLAGIVGIAMIVGGVVVLNAFSGLAH